MRVLLIDAYDECDMYAHYLQTSGFDVRAVRTGRDGLRAALGEKVPHAIIVGSVLPDLPGDVVVSTIKQMPDRSTVPVILLTGYWDAVHRERFQACGADAVVLKPCLPEDLRRLVRRLIAGASPRTAAKSALPSRSRHRAS